ncbi:hypothetical protein GPECTOR_3g331 [Gonium pectorale]|uniref:Uncharacterized protein n=1 Tax=Gonium pectorale TaxID=33097 RepID=A0A150GZ48_GONPE|nr:hypothetical protein GPECTOR_3g331 [Gonium pectorale]|eukprot:KXZ55186.1 hypothetical protein GPECTOR_3g331 [Gonium pectorale]
MRMVLSKLEQQELDLTRVEELGEWCFVEKKLPISCLALLSKGPKAPFQSGNDAAHTLRTVQPDLFRQAYLAGLPEEEQPAWKKLYQFMSYHPVLLSVKGKPELCRWQDKEQLASE